MSFWFVKGTGVAGLAVALLSASCALPDTSERGFGSTQVLHVRDSALSLRSFSFDESGIYLARTVPNVVANDLAVPYDRSLLTFASGVERQIAVGVVNVPPLLPSADGKGRTLVMAHFQSDQEIPGSLSTKELPLMDLTFLDEVTGVPLDLHDVDSQTQSFEFGATREDPILIRRKGFDGKIGFWVGPAERLAQAPDVNQIVGRYRLGLVALSPSPGGMTQSISRVPFDGSPLVELVPGTLNEHLVLADPAVPTTPTAGPSVIATAGVEVAVNCPDATAANPEPRCLVVYDRQRGGLRVPFVHDVDTGTDVELPGPVTGSLSGVLRVGPGARDVFWPTVGSGTIRLYAWHVRDTQAVSCVIQGAPSTLSFGVNGWRPSVSSTATGAGAASSGAQFVVVAQPISQSPAKPATWTLIAGTTGQECQVVTQGPNLIRQVSYSPDGNAIAFVESDPDDMCKIYVTDGHAASPRVVATGPRFFNIDFHDPRHLLVWHSSIDGYSLSWLDISTTPAVEHPIADGVRWDFRGFWAWINPRWVLLADQDSMSEGSYSLNVVDLETGANRLISRGVVDFRVSWATPPPGATTLTVAYIVRSRAASSQDGLWVAHLPLADFPP